jgi:hypothetical protein
VLRREQLLAGKEERIEAFMRQLQNMGLGELADAIEDAFKDVLRDLRQSAADPPPMPAVSNRMADGGVFAHAVAQAAPMTGDGERAPLTVVEELDALTGLSPQGMARRFLERLDSELEARERGEVWDRSDRLRYLARTFEDAGNHDKAVEFARRGLLILEHFR